MPNWCENELTITGPDVSKILEAIRSVPGEDEDARVLDFDRILPYPQAFKQKDQRAHEYQQRFLAIQRTAPEAQDQFRSLAAEFEVEAGTPWLQDGFNSGGYEWCCENWGTKWNAAHPTLTTRPDDKKGSLLETIQCPYCQTVHRIEPLTIWICRQCGSPLPDRRPLLAFLEFDTAWSPPVPVIERLAARFPDHEFILKYYEGGCGFCGHAFWSAGLEQFHHLFEYSGPRGG
jgi:hypothetical protein